MKNFAFVFAALFAASTSFGAAITDDKVTVGKPGSSANKEIIYGTGGKKLTHKPATSELDFNGNNLTVGDGTSSDKVLKFNTGGTPASIKWNNSTSKLEFSNDNTLFKSIGSGSGGGGGGFSVLSNAGFEDGVGGVTGWTNSGGTFASATSGGAQLELKSANFTPSSSGQYFESSSYTIPAGLYGQPCLARGSYYGGDANIKMQVTDGSGTVLSTNGTNVEQVLKAVTQPTLVELGFTCPSSGSIKLRVISTASGAISNWDTMHLGSDDRMFRQARASKVAAVITWTGTGSCIMGSGATNLTTDLSVTSGTCTGVTPNIVYQAIGSCSNVATGNLKFTCSDMPEGTYTLVYEGSATMNVSNVAGSIGIYDGITAPVGMQINGANGALAGITVSNTFTYSSKGTRVWRVVGNGQGNSVAIYMRTATEAAKMTIYYDPPASQDTYFQTTSTSDLTFVNDFTAYVSDGSPATVSNESVDWLNGNCTRGSTGQYNCPFNAGVFTTQPVCFATYQGTSGYVARIAAVNTTASVDVNVNNTATAALVNGNFSVTCKKVGADYKVRSTILGSVPTGVYVKGTNTGRNYFATYFGGSAGDYTSACSVVGSCFLRGATPNITSIVYTTSPFRYMLTVPAGSCKTGTPLICNWNAGSQSPAYETAGCYSETTHCYTPADGAGNGISVNGNVTCSCELP